jgi:hypothetical protein
MMPPQRCPLCHRTAVPIAEDGAGIIYRCYNAAHGVKGEHTFEVKRPPPARKPMLPTCS